MLASSFTFGKRHATPCLINGNQWGPTRLIPALEMDVLRCKSQPMVDKEIAVYFLAYNLVRWAGCGSLARGRVATGVEF